MDCKYCGEEMELSRCGDNGGGGYDYDIAYNIYICDNPDCMAICRNDVWDFKGCRWIAPQHKETNNC